MTRQPDRFGLALAIGLAAAFLATGGAAVFCEFLSVRDALFLVGLGVVLLAAHPQRLASTPMRNTFAHGSARLASKREVQTTVNRSKGAETLDSLEFKD